MNNDKRQLCKTCKWRSDKPSVNRCDYIFLTDKKRPCPADNCTAYEKGKRAWNRKDLKIKKRRATA